MNSFFSFLFRDPLRKLIALLLTIVLYAVLNEGKQQQKDIAHVPVKINCDPDVFMSKVAANTTLHVVVRGSESRIKNLDIQSIYATVNVTRKTPGFESGNVTVVLEPKDFVTPPGIEVISIEPKNLVLPVEKKVSKEVKIVPVVQGRPRSGLDHDGGRCSPDVVTVSGAERALRDLQEIRTEPVTIPRGESRSFSKTVNLISPGEDFVLNISRTEVIVTITDEMSRILPDRIAVNWHCPLNWDKKIVPVEKAVSVTIAGLQDEINKISGESVMVFADLNDPKYNTPGEYDIPVKAILNTPGHVVRIIKIEPAVVRVKIEVPAVVPDKK